MYGLILENVASYVRKAYGPQVWQEVLYVAGMEHSEFENTTTYSEGFAQRIIWAVQDVTGVTNEDLMEKIGESFYDFITNFEYDQMLQVLGRRFTDFLNGLDNLHEYIKFTFPKLKPPSFYCEHESKTGVTLHYRSKRRGFMHYVRGQIKYIAKKLYDCDVKIEVVDRETDERMNQHVIFRLHFNNIDFKKDKGHAHDESGLDSMLQITADIFFDIFPFVIVFNRGMRIQNIGLGLARIRNDLIGKKINREFVMLHPLVNFTWEQIMLHSNNVFEIISIEPAIKSKNQIIYRSGAEYSENRVPQGPIVAHLTSHQKVDDCVSYEVGGILNILKNFKAEEEMRRMQAEQREQFLTLKGAMMYMSDWESICFMGIPVMDNLEQMLQTGLYINEFAMHDSSRELVVAQTQQAAEIKLLLDQEHKKKEKLAESMAHLEAEIKRSDELLYQMLPASVADKLRSGLSTVSTCESFESVTCLFTDIVGFTTLCSGLTPLAVVSFLNKMYSCFDSLTEKHQVFKVETIGDAYVVVSGAPNRTPHHAELAADCIIDIIQSVGTMFEDTTKQRVRIRAGLHSGPVVTGVVGLKMPRYCLFGDTVLIANKMESTGKPMKIQVSQTTKESLDINAKNQFKFSSYSVFEYKVGKVLKTFWLDGKQGPPKNG